MAELIVYGNGTMVSHQYHSMHSIVTASTSEDVLRSFAQIGQIRLRHLGASGRAMLTGLMEEPGSSLQDQCEYKTENESLYTLTAAANTTSPA
jgi:DNA-binding IclR family transcriptional regulator